MIGFVVELSVALFKNVIRNDFFQQSDPHLHITHQKVSENIICNKKNCLGRQFAKKVVQDNNLQKKNVRKYAEKILENSCPKQKNCKKKICPRQQFVKAVSETKNCNKKSDEKQNFATKKVV